MTTYSKATLNTARYAAARPTYPRQLYDFVFQYHERTRGARWDTAIDLGCGTGQAMVELTPFKRVVGVDPSTKMIEGARAAVAKTHGGDSRFEFHRATAENVSTMPDGSVDLIVAAQAAHWFDYTWLWPEVARLLRKGGSAAFWGYSEMRLQQHPRLTPLLTSYWNGTDVTASLGPHWQQPGRSILDNHFLDVPKATDAVPEAFTDWEHVLFSGDYFPNLPNSAPNNPASLHTFHERYPEDLKNPNGDLATRFWRKLREETREHPGSQDAIDVEWPVVLMMVKRI